MKHRQHWMRAVAAMGLLSSVASPVWAVTHVVNQSAFVFSPANITVAPGDTVEWHWSSGIHTVTSGTPCTADGIHFDSPLTSANPVVSWVVPNDGTTSVPYFCTLHCLMGMVGTITIEVPGPLPTVSEWGLVVLVLSLLCVGTVVIRRRGMVAV